MSCVGGEACGHIRSYCAPHGSNVFFGDDGVVTVEDEEGHYPEDKKTLREVIIVEGVHKFAEVGPDVPGWRKNELLVGVKNAGFSECESGL